MARKTEREEERYAVPAQCSGMGVLGVSWRLLVNLPRVVLAVFFAVVMLVVAAVDSALGALFDR